MDKKYYKYIMIILIIVILAFTLITLWGSSTTENIGLDTSTFGKTVIKVHVNDNLNGKMTIYEFSNIIQNSNGTYNLSQFGDYYGLLGFYSNNKGNSKDIQIINGTAEYEVPNGVDFILIYPYITDLSKTYDIDSSNTTTKITVEVYINGVLKYTCSNIPYSTQCNIDFGDKLIRLSDGNALTDIDLIPDTLHNSIKESSESDTQS